MALRHHKKKIIAGSIVCAVIAFLAMLPLALKPAIELAIHSNGFPQAKVGSIRFLPSGILIENIFLDKDGFSTVDNIQITGPWRDLIIDHKADRVSVKAIELNGEVDAGNHITIAGWDGKFNTPAPGGEKVELPFNSFNLDGMTVDLETPVGGLRTQAKAILEKNKTGGQTLNASIWASQKIFSTTINLNATRDAQGTVSGKADIQDTSVDITPVSLSRLSGWVEFKSMGALSAAGQIMVGGVKYKDKAFEDSNITFDTTQDTPALFKTKMSGTSLLVNAQWMEKPERKISATVSSSNLGEFAALANVKNDLLTASGPVEIGIGMNIGDGFHPDNIASITTNNIKFAGGNISALPFKWDMGSTKNSLTVKLDKLQLAALAGKNSDSIKTTGSISGTIPVRVEKDDVYIDNAVLTSDQPGSIKYAPDKMPASLQGDDSRIATVRQALSNYNYDTMQIMLDGPLNGNLKTNLSAKGKSPAFENRTVNLNLNLEGALTSALTQALQPGAMSDKLQKQLTEGVK